ncbi:MAG: hypothetical protein FJY47_08465 [Betaproteobacteria bacterium]|nr:hypothetical protein [Betaproteobacteria bacterium]
MELATVLKPGLAGDSDLVVGDEHTAPRIGCSLVQVLASPMMINRLEAAALEAHCERQLIGGGELQRVVVNVEKFDARVARKLAPES